MFAIVPTNFPLRKSTSPLSIFVTDLSVDVDVTLPFSTVQTVFPTMSIDLYALLSPESASVTATSLNTIQLDAPKPLNNSSAKSVKAILSTPLSLDTLRKKWHNYKSINMDTSVKVLVSHHPSTLLKSPKQKKEAGDDLKMLQKKLNEN